MAAKYRLRAVLLPPGRLELTGGTGRAFPSDIFGNYQPQEHPELFTGCASPTEFVYRGALQEISASGLARFVDAPVIRVCPDPNAKTT